MRAAAPKRFSSNDAYHKAGITMSIADQLHPTQPFFGIDILRWREIFRVIETSSSDINLIRTFVVRIGERRSTVRTKGPPGAGLRLISVWRSFSELELRTF